MAAPVSRPLQPIALPGFEQIERNWSTQHECWAAKIKPGEFYVTKKNEMISTVLGSCISVCMRDPVSGIGGMNHFMLPEDSNKCTNAINGLGTRYGNVAMELLINGILGNGGYRNSLEIKIFGGGKVINMTSDIGAKNIEFVRKFMKSEGYHTTAEDVGDTTPRKVLYFPKDGSVLMKKIRDAKAVAQSERAYQSQIQSDPVDGSIELF